MRIRRSALFLIIAAAFACNESTRPTTGKAEITLAVSGLDVDPDGYEVMVNGNSATTLTGPGSITLDLSLGQHAITLGALASNCTLQSPVVDEITVSQSATARSSFAVVCTALTGVVQVTALTTGTDIDPDGYQVALADSVVQPLAAVGTVWIGGVSGGTHSLSLGGLAANCSVTGSNPVNVSVTVGGLVRDTARVTLNVTCTALTGVVHVTAATTGTDLDPDGYQITLDGGPVHALAANGAIWIAGVSGGTHSLSLGGVASNCSVAGSNPVSVGVTVGGLVRDTAQVAFSVGCTPLPRTGADLVVTTTGTTPDDQYSVVIYSSNCDYYCDVAWQGTVPANGTVPITLPVDSYTYNVTDIAANCSGPTFGGFDVTNQHVTSVALAYTCVASGTVVVGVHASGVDVPPDYWIVVDGTSGSSVPAGGNVSLILPIGTHSIALSQLASNCTVASPNPVSVTVSAGVTSDVNFSVTCAAIPILRVTVATTGSNAPANYLVGVDPDYYYGYTYTAAIPSNGTVSMRIPAGDHIVTLDGVPLSCSVTSPNNVSVTLLPGGTTDLAFSVSCH